MRVEQLVESSGVAWIGVPAWSQLEWLWHGFSTRSGGVSRAYLADDQKLGDGPGEMNLGFTSEDRAEDVEENRQQFVGAVTGSRETPLVTVRQVHSNRVVVAQQGASAEADGLMTGQQGIALGIQTADCIPVLIVDLENRAVAALHAGWRGTVERVVELGIARMKTEYGSQPANLLAAIGPGIGPCCYTVGAEVVDRFKSKFVYAGEVLTKDEDGSVRLNLTQANQRQLLAAGLPEESISTVGECTGCHPERYYSHRNSGGHAGRMMALIGIRPAQ